MLPRHLFVVVICIYLNPSTQDVFCHAWCKTGTFLAPNFDLCDASIVTSPEKSRDLQLFGLGCFAVYQFLNGSDPFHLPKDVVFLNPLTSFSWSLACCSDRLVTEASNQLSSVVGAFDQLPQLQSLNLSGNRLCSFKEAVGMGQLPVVLVA